MYKLSITMKQSVYLTRVSTCNYFPVVHMRRMISEDDRKQSRPKVLYDGECPLCVKEINVLKWMDKNKQNVHFIDITQGYKPEDNMNISLKDAMSVMHVIDKDGNVHQRVEAMHVMYNAVGLGWLWKWTNIPGIKHAVDSMYMMFARNRLRLTGREWCETGRCTIKRK